VEGDYIVDTGLIPNRYVRAWMRSSTVAASKADFNQGDTIGLLIDCDVGSMTVWKNDRKLGVCTEDLPIGEPLCFAVGLRTKHDSVSIELKRSPPEEVRRRRPAFAWCKKGVSVTHDGKVGEVIKKGESATRDWVKLRWADGSESGWLQVSTLKPASGGGAVQIRAGEGVEYFSTTYGGWIKATVERVHSDGTVTLDVRKRADRSKVRRR
jgi:hypothetical protein